MASQEVHTGVTSEVQAINDTVATLIDAGKMEEARAAYEKVQVLTQNLGTRLQTVSAPSIIVKPDKTERRIISPEEALDLMQGRVFGADKMQKAFRYAPEQIPGISASTLELKNAARLGQSLRLRAPLDMKGIDKKVGAVNEQKKESDRRRALYSIDRSDCWYLKEDFFKSERPKGHWALTSGEPVECTFKKNRIEQVDLLILVLEASFKDMSMPTVYVEALAEYKQMRPKIESLLYTDRWPEASLSWSQLQIVKLLFGTPAEVLSDINVDQDNGGSLLRSVYTITSARASGGMVVDVGGADPGGAVVDGWSPDSCRSNLGAAFSRRLS